jgi:hypothetical protein
MPRDSSATFRSCSVRRGVSDPSGCSNQRPSTSVWSASIGASELVGSRPVASERRHESTIVGRSPAVAPGGSSGPSAPSANRRSQLPCSCRARLSRSVPDPRATHCDVMALRAYSSRPCWTFPRARPFLVRAFRPLPGCRAADSSCQPRRRFRVAGMGIPRARDDAGRGRRGAASGSP